MILFSVGLISYSEPVNAQSNPIDIVQSTEPQNATQQQFETVQTWFFENGDSLTESEQNTVGSWVTAYQSGESSSSGSSSSSSEQSDPPESIEIDISDNMKLVDYQFKDDSVEITLYASNSTEQVVLSQYVDTSEAGVQKVPQKGVTVPRGQQVTTSFNTTVPISVSTGINETVSISQGSSNLVDTLSWNMIPLTALSTALAIFSIGVFYVRRTTKKMKNSYVNVYKQG